MSVTIVVTVSRSECVELVKENLRNLDLGNNRIELIIMVDNRHVREVAWLDGLRSEYEKVTIEYVDNGIKPPLGNIPKIRDRISNVRNESKQWVGSTDFVFSFEDDTIVPKNSLVKLLKEYGRLENPGLISGLQVGRHGRRILGAWYADNYQFPNELKTLGRKEMVTPLVEVDAAGMYCYLTPTNLYKSATYGWHEPVGPDVWYGLWLRTKGYVNYVDQSIVCGHKVGDKILVPDKESIKVRFFKKHGQWTHEPING